MLDQVVSLVADLGLGAIAIGLVRVLQKNVAVTTELVKELKRVVENHEERLDKLEKGH